MGIEAVKSSTPAPCRSAIKEAIKIMMTGTESDLVSYIDSFRQTFDSLPPEEIAFPRSVNGLRKFKSSTSVYTKGERRLMKALCRSLIRSVRWNLKSILRVLMKRWRTT